MNWILNPFIIVYMNMKKRDEKLLYANQSPTKLDVIPHNHWFEKTDPTGRPSS